MDDEKLKRLREQAEALERQGKEQLEKTKALGDDVSVFIKETMDEGKWRAAETRTILDSIRGPSTGGVQKKEPGLVGKIKRFFGLSK